MNKYYVIILSLLGIYWIVSAILQHGPVLLIIPGMVSLLTVISLNFSSLSRYSDKLFLPTLLYNLVLTIYQSYSSFSVLTTRFLILEIGILIINLIFSIILFFMVLQVLRKNPVADIS